MDSTAGFVLTGGRSSRMGRGKVLLSIEGSLLLERNAERVGAAEFAYKVLKMHDLLESLEAISWPVSDTLLLDNVSTPIEWGTR